MNHPWIPLDKTPESSKDWALFGFVLYSVFDFTNLTFIKDYPLKFALVDIAWWSFLVWISSVISYKIINYFF